MVRQFVSIRAGSSSPAFRRLTIEDQTQDVKGQPEGQTPFDTGGTAGDVVAPGSIGVTLASTIKSGERDG